VQPTGSNLSLVRDGKKFAIIKVSAARLDVGIKLKDLLALQVCAARLAR